MLNDRTLAILGLPKAADVNDAALRLVKAAGEDGLSPRDLHRKQPHLPLWLCYEALAELNRLGYVRHQWRGCKGATHFAAQESAYTIPPKEPTDAAG